MPDIERGLKNIEGSDSTFDLRHSAVRDSSFVISQKSKKWSVFVELARSFKLSAIA